jgi:GTP-binding protein
MVKDGESGELVADLVAPGQTYRAARGGRGGRGNARFATSTNQAPRRADPGEAGGEHWLELELKLIADVGLVGLPNAGKSTLLSRVSRARPKIASYPFTTLEPNLGIVALDAERRFVMADVPGLIADAHLGRGLGLQFLRHLERTRALVFMLDVASEDAAGDLAMLENELSMHSQAFATKPKLVVLTKADLLPEQSRAEAPARAALPDARLVSAHSGTGLRELLETLWTLIGAPEPDAIEDEDEDEAR